MAAGDKRVSVTVDADGRGAISGFASVGDAAEEAAARATEAGAKVSAAAVKQADTASQSAARAAETATAESKAAQDAFVEGATEAYDRLPRQPSGLRHRRKRLGTVGFGVGTGPVGSRQGGRYRPGGSDRGGGSSR